MKAVILIVLALVLIGGGIFALTLNTEGNVPELNDQSDVAGYALGARTVQEHIEDTNGAHDFSLETITNEHIVAQSIAPLDLTKEKDPMSKGIMFNSDSFSGIYEVFSIHYSEPTTLEMVISGYFVHSGNFKMVLLNNDQIVAVIEPKDFVNFTMDNLSGEVSLVIAGESANFTFSFDPEYCEMFGITLDE